MKKKAWRETAVLYDQSHHMDNLFLTGSDAIKLISDTAINSVAIFPVEQGQAVRADDRLGHVIGDGILFHEAEDEYVYVGRAPASNWLLYHGETGGYRTSTSPSTAARRRAPYGDPVTRQYYRFQIQGPPRGGHREAQRRPARAARVLHDVDDADRRQDGAHAPPRHGRRAGPRDLGAYADHHRPRRDRRGRRRVRPGAGRLARLSVEHARVRLDPVAAARDLHRRAERATASGCPASYEATGTLAGSFVSDDIEDYYLTPGSSAMARS